jgi:signal transduction histidine kinase
MTALRRLSLAKRGGLFLCCGLLVVFAAFGGLSVFGVRKSAERVSEWTMRSAHAAAQRLSERLQHQQDGVEHLAQWPGMASSLELLQAGLPGVSPSWATLDYLAADPHDFGDCVFVTARDGTIIWTKPSGLGLLNRNVSDYPEIQAVLARGESYTSDVILNGFWPEPHILMATPIKNPQHQVVGLVGSVIAARTLRSGELFNEVRRLTDEASQAEMDVADTAGVIVTSTNPDRVFTRIPDERMLSHIRLQEESLSTSNHGTVQAVHPISPLRWSLIVEQSSNDLYREIYQLKRNLVGVGLLVTLLTLVVWAPFLSSFVGPLRALTREAERIASGDLSHSIKAEGRDEIALLSESLDHMRKQLQSQQGVLQTQIIELRKTNRLKSEFIANLSHEFRTPVHIMRGYTDLVLQGAFGDVPHSLHEPLAIVSKQYTSLWALLESCLDLAKLDAGEVYAEIQTFDLCDLVEEIMDEFLPQLEAKCLRSVITVPSQCQDVDGYGLSRCHVRSDRGKVQRILRNLVSNAVKFTSQGEVEVRAEDGPRADTFTLRVRDTGIGIHGEDQQIIFERFRQADGSATRRHGGAGLGLHIAHELVRFLGGDISLSSGPGSGSTFSVVLPRTFVGSADLRSHSFLERTSP